MPARTRKELSADLKKGEILPAYYLYGAQDVFKDEIVQAILDRVLDPSLRDFNFDQRSAGALDAEAIESLCYTLPMMAERRVVLIRDLESWKRKPKARTALIKYLERPAAETVVILVQSSAEDTADKDLVRLTVAVDCADPTPAETIKWLTARAAAVGVQFAPGAAEHLLKCVESDLTLLRLELEKLKSLPEGEPVTVQQVGDLVGVRHGETQFDWRDAVMNGDTAKAITLLSRVLEQSGISGVKLIMLLGTTLLGVGVTRAAYDRKARGRALDTAAWDALRAARPGGLGPWKAEAANWARWAELWPMPRVQQALRAALDTDRSLKNTTLSDERGLIADLVMRLAVVRAAAA